MIKLTLLLVSVIFVSVHSFNIFQPHEPQYNAGYSQSSGIRGDVKKKTSIIMDFVHIGGGGVKEILCPYSQV